MIRRARGGDRARERPAARCCRERPDRTPARSDRAGLPRSQIRGWTDSHADDGERGRPTACDRERRGGRILFDPERAFSSDAYPSGGGGATATLVNYVRFARLLLNGGRTGRRAPASGGDNRGDD